MPGYCAPCPVNRNTTSGSRPGRPSPVQRWRASRRAASAVQRRRGHGGSVATTARRSAKCERPTPAVPAASANRGARSADERAGSRVRRAPQGAGVRADSGRQCSDRRSGAGHVGAGRGASSRITWALVPLKPNELTPARRGARRAATAGPAAATRDRVSFPGDVRARVRGSAGAAGAARAAATSTTLMTPATPAADSRWPMLVLTEPTSSGVVDPATRRRSAPRQRLAPRSDRRATCRCRGPRRSRRRSARQSAVAPARRGSPLPAPARSARSARRCGRPG